METSKLERLGLVNLLFGQYVVNVGFRLLLFNATAQGFGDIWIQISFAKRLEPGRRPNCFN